MPDRLTPGQSLFNNASITSGDGRFRLIMQTDGNLVLYRNSDNRANRNLLTVPTDQLSLSSTGGRRFFYTAILRCRTGAPTVRLSAASMMALASMPWWR